MIRQIPPESRDPDAARAALPAPLGPVEETRFFPLDQPRERWPVERAYAYCEQFAHVRTEIFEVTSRLVKAELRPHLAALYAFVRSADDFAAEAEYEGRRVEALDDWGEKLRRSCHGEATHPVFVALADTIAKRNLPIPPLEDMLSAVRDDLGVRRYGTFQELCGYTARSAGPVGRLLLALFGCWRPELVRFADELSNALQLTVFWQDVATDAERDHIYIPVEDLHFFGVSEADVKALEPTNSLRDLLRFEVARTRALYERGRPLLERSGTELHGELARICRAGTGVLDTIEAADFDVFTQRPTRLRRDNVVAACGAKDRTGRLDLGTLSSLWPRGRRSHRLPRSTPVLTGGG